VREATAEEQEHNHAHWWFALRPFLSLSAKTMAANHK
jgi:hypothetical protein